MSPIDKAIDPARVGLSKSLMTGVCDRKSFFGETVRDASGRRLPFTASESMLFGKVIDVAHGHIVWHIREGRDWTVDAAARDGFQAIAAEADVIVDRAAFVAEVKHALDTFLTNANGLAMLMPLIPGIRIQGNDGESLRADDIIGTPDYLLVDGSPLDVKTTNYGTGDFSYDRGAFTRKAEMPIYAFLSAAQEGALPGRLIYQVYVRTKGGYWQWNEVPCTSAHVDLGRIHAARWRAGIASKSPDMFGFSTRWCGDCQFAQAIPEVGFDGCAVGLAMKGVAA